MNKRNITVAILILLVVTIAIVPIYKTLSTSEVQADTAFVATISDTNQYTDGIELTESGIELNNWQYNTSKYLQINPTVPDDENIYIVTVELPKELYVVGTELTLPTGYSNVEFTKNEDISVDNGETYTINALSGKIEYTMNDTSNSGTIQLEVRYDNTLWDKQAGSSLTMAGVKPIVVKLSKKATDETITLIKELSVSKATSNSAISYEHNNYYKIDSGSETMSDIIVSPGQLVTFLNSFSNSNGIEELYYDKLSINVNLPYYTALDGKKYFLELDTSTLNFLSCNNPNYQIDTSVEGIVSIVMTKTYFTSGNFLSIDFKDISQELLDLDIDTFVFTGGKIDILADSNNKTTNINICSKEMNNITYHKSTYENLVFNYTSNKDVQISKRPVDAISILGSFGLQNTGTKASVRKEIFQEFDIENTNFIKVTTVALPVDRVSENIEIEYSLVDNEGNQIYFDATGNPVDSSTSGATNTWNITLPNANYNNNSTNTSIVLSRSNLITAHKQYFFKTIKYQLQTIDAGDSLFSSSSPFAIGTPGNFYGYVNDSVGSGTTAKTKITISSPNNLEITSLNTTIKSVATDSSKTSFYFDNVSMSENSIQAGNSLNLSGTLKCISYPYTNSTWLNDIVIGLVLPSGVSVNEQGIRASTSGISNITGFTVASKELGDGTNLWTIKYPSNVYIGYLTESFSELSSGYYTDFSIQLDTSSTMNNTSLFANNLLYGAGINQENGILGSYAWTQKTDIHDINENGNTNDIIAGVNSTDTTTCQITAKIESLDITDSIILNSQGNIGNEKNEIFTLTQDDVIIYNVDIACNNSGKAEDFCGYIPIPKLTTGRDELLVESSISDSFNMKLQSAVSLTGSDIYTIYYSFEEGLTYETAKTAVTWYLASDIESNNDLSFDNVTMIKVVANNIIQTSNNTRITVNMKYSGDNYVQDAGLKNIWHSGFYFNYITNELNSAGNCFTKGVKANLTVTSNLPEITLTAAKDMTPIISENKNEYTATYEQFKKNQIFSIVNVENYNVSLKSKQYVLNNTTMSGIKADETFAITAQINGQTEKDILETVSTEPILLGNVDKNNLLEYKFKIYNANTITDNTQTRYIIVTLKSDNGITLKQKININRELTEASNPQSAIVAGKRYITFDDTTTSVTITQDSAITAQFVIDYIPNSYTNQKLKFSNLLPINTKLILMDLSDFSTPNYWSYKTTSYISEIKLTDFIKMGTKTEKYVRPIGDDTIRNKFLVLMDFSECTEFLQEETSIQMNFTSVIDSDFNSTELKFVPTTKRSFELINSLTEVAVGDDLQINYNMISNSSAESKYLGRKLSLVINAPTSIPLDSYIIANDTKYYLNTNKQFIIPLSDVQNGNGEIVVNLNSNSLPIEQINYECSIQLWVSATANAKAPLLGELVAENNVTFTKLAELKPALIALDMNKRALKKDDLTLANTLIFNYKPADNCKVEIELQQKNGNVYQKITDRLNQVNNSTEHNLGVFQISATSGENTITYNLSSETTAGTYRFVLRVKDENNNKLLEVPYNFIILDE